MFVELKLFEAQHNQLLATGFEKIGNLVFYWEAEQNKESILVIVWQSILHHSLLEFGEAQ